MPVARSHRGRTLMEGDTIQTDMARKDDGAIEEEAGFSEALGIRLRGEPPQS